MRKKAKWWRIYNLNFDYFIKNHSHVLDLVDYCHLYNISDSEREKAPKDGTRSIPNCFQYVKNGSWKMNANSFAKFWADKGVEWGKINE